MLKWKIFGLLGLSFGAVGIGCIVKALNIDMVPNGNYTAIRIMP